MEKILENVLMCIDKMKTKKNNFQVFAGFDGYVDTLVKPIRSVQENGDLSFFSSISDFGTYLNQKAGKSCSIELHKVVDKVGGNAAIYAMGISNLEIRTKCVGAFGYPETQKIFKQAGENLELFSISAPGYCMALEFSDGKVMLSENAGINDLDFKTLTERLGEAELYRLIHESDVISLMNWSEVFGCTDIWRGILECILPKLPKDSRKKMFVDISDCSRRGTQDIRQMVELLGRFSDYCDVTLSLNVNEFEILCETLGLSCETNQLTQIGETIRKACALKNLVIHMLDGSYAFDEKLSYFVENRYVEQPLISTGGGDNFNAGLVYGIIIGMDIQSAMTTANAASGFYVINGRSAALEELYQYIMEWKYEKREDTRCLQVKKNDYQTLNS